MVSHRLGCSNEPPPKSPTPLSAVDCLGRVKLSSSLVDERGGDFRCECVYVADRYGAVDTRVQSSVGGTFEGIQSTGLLDHLVAVEPGHRLLKRDVTTPWCVAVQSYVPRLQTQTANMHPVCNHTYPGA